MRRRTFLASALGGRLDHQRASNEGIPVDLRPCDLKGVGWRAGAQVGPPRQILLSGLDRLPLGFLTSAVKEVEV